MCGKVVARMGQLIWVQAGGGGYYWRRAKEGAECTGTIRLRGGEGS